MSTVFGPDETVLLSSKGSMEQPVSGSGEFYLTTRRLLLVHKSGLIRKRETPLVDIGIDEISYFKVEGILRKVLVLGVRLQGGRIQAYKVHVRNPESWKTHIFNLKNKSST
ncbi:MAG: hypothetical protein HYU39_00385 [Thaumarchaeota archaeon]|nr:hypothetical protein [Nitrososphaerota archaeon]